MRIAVAQTPGTRLEQWRDTLALIDELIARAARLGAELVVLPECVWPAYVLGTPAAYLAARRAGLPGHAAFLDHLAEQARARGVAICAGYVEEAGDRLFNAACLTDAAGRLCGTHRKCFLWDFDHQTFAPGERIEPIDARFGRVGIMICADARLPEIPATLAARGAQLILQPTGWVHAGVDGAGVPPADLWNPQPDFLIAARAREFGLPIASASKWGIEGDTTFVGSSLICDSRGEVLVQCGQRETTVVAADVELGEPRRPELTDAERTALLSTEPPVEVRTDVPRLTLFLTDAGGLDYVRAYAAGRVVAAGPVLAAMRPGDGSRTGPWLLRWNDRLALVGGPISREFELARVKVAALTSPDATRFAPLRRLARDGLHVGVVFGGIDRVLLRARACENRIFVIGAAPETWCVIDPRGCMVAEGHWPNGPAETKPVEINPALAADKHVAPHTDVLRDRRPVQYCLDPG